MAVFKLDLKSVDLERLRGHSHAESGPAHGTCGESLSPSGVKRVEVHDEVRTVHINACGGFLGPDGVI